MRLAKIVKRTIPFLILIVLLSCSSFYPNRYGNRNIFESFSILSVESYWLETIPGIRPGTHNFTPSKFASHSGETDSYIYGVRIKLAVFNDLDKWNIPFFMHLEYVDHDSSTIQYDPELILVRDGAFPIYYAEIEIKKKGELWLILGIPDIYGNIIFDDTNQYCTTTFTIE